MHAHLPKTTMNGHWRKLKTDVSLSLGSVMWSLFSYQNVLFSDEKDFLSLPALRGNEAWIKILHNFTSSCYHKAVGCSPFSCTVVVDLYFYFFCIVLNDNGVDVGGFLSLFLCCFLLLLLTSFNCLYFLGSFWMNYILSDSWHMWCWIHAHFSKQKQWICFSSLHKGVIPLSKPIPTRLYHFLHC